MSHTSQLPVRHIDVCSSLMGLRVGRCASPNAGRKRLPIGVTPTDALMRDGLPAAAGHARQVQEER